MYYDLLDNCSVIRYYFSSPFMLVNILIGYEFTTYSTQPCFFSLLTREHIIDLSLSVASLRYDSHISTYYLERANVHHWK